MKQNDYFNESVPEHLRELLQTKGIQRSILEVQNLKAVTNLCITATENLKLQDFKSILFLIMGSMLTILSSKYMHQDESQKLSQVHTILVLQQKEINGLKHQIEMRRLQKVQPKQTVSEKSK